MNVTYNEFMCHFITAEEENPLIEPEETEPEDNPYKDNVEDPQRDLLRETLETLREN